MATLNSRVIISKNIKIDKNYKNVLNYSENNMLELLLSNNHLVNQDNTYQFININNKIRVNFSYQDCLTANYIAFQNPNYSNKWFFAWIEHVEFKSQNCCEITYVVDAWSTWFDYWNQKPCYVIREHVNDDEIGLHTIPENIELGDYVLNSRKEDFMAEINNFAICMAVSELPDESVPPYTNNRVYNGIFGGLYYLGFNSPAECQNAIRIYDKLGKANSINSLFMIPKTMESFADGTSASWSISQGGETIGTANLVYLTGSNESDTIGNINVVFPSKIGNNYVPKNNKLFTYPYCFFNLTNNSGITESFRYEDFVKEDNIPSIAFWVSASITPGMSMKAIPLFYKNENINYNFGIMSGKLPVCSYDSDVYLNWLRQNGLNSVFNVIGGVISTAGAIGSGSIGGAVGGLSSIYNALHQHTIADMTPNQAKGNTNGGDINFSDTSCGLFTIYKMSIKDEYAKIIDDYFSRYGYRINEVKMANITGRNIFNYIEIGHGESIGYSEGNISVPTEYMEIINNACQNGITIWHSHGNIGNYNLSNNII